MKFLATTIQTPWAMSKYKYTPEHIYNLGINEIFVFGSNRAGRHGAGAAKIARKWGAEYGNPRGLQGHTYAIPTKDEKIKTLSLPEIKKEVDLFLIDAVQNYYLTFLVTKIGCGLAGYTPDEIAPFFAGASQNVVLPIEFEPYR